MSHDEFLKIAAYITAGTGKAIAPESMMVYFDLLGDLPFEVLLTGAKRVILEHPWPSFPSIAELREAASEAARGKVSDLSATDAWGLVWKAVARIDPEVSGSFERATRGYPTIVVEAMKSFGIFALCSSSDPVSVIRGQFLKMFEQIAAREKRAALLPEPVKKAIENIGQQLPSKFTKGIGEIGLGPEDKS